MIEEIVTQHKIWIDVFTLLIAIIIGGFQIAINTRLKALQDYTAVVAVPGKNSKIVLHNAGKVNLYLWGFDMPGNVQRFDRPRLLPVGTGDTAYFWINPPSKENLVNGKEFGFKAYLKDAFGKKYTADFGGRAEHSESGDLKVTIWTYDMKEEKWSIATN